MTEITIKNSIVASELIHRTREPRETIQNAQKYINISNLMELSVLDDTGIPVFACINKDMHNPVWGAGVDLISAKASVLMKNIEIKNAYDINRKKIIHSSFNDLKDKAVSRFDLIPTNYQRELYKKDIYDKKKIRWYPSYSLFQDKEVYLPASLIGLSISDDIYDRKDVNGLATGNSTEEALLYGLCDIFANHAFSMHFFNDLDIDVIDPLSCDNPAIRDIVQGLAYSGFSIYLADHTQDLPMPVLSLILLREDEDPLVSSSFFMAWSCHPDPETAFLRCIQKIASARIRHFYRNFILRDSANYKYYGKSTLNGELKKRIQAKTNRSMRDIESIINKDIKYELEIVFDYLKRKDMILYIADLASDEIPLPTVRAVIPHLQPALSPDMPITDRYNRVSEYLHQYDYITKGLELKNKHRSAIESKILNTDYIVLQNNLSISYMKMGDLDRALEISEIIYKQEPENIKNSLIYGEILFKKTSYIISHKVFMDLISKLEERKDIIIAAYYLMKINNILKNKEEVKEYMNLILGLYPENKLPSSKKARDIYIRTQLIKLESEIKNAKEEYLRDRTPYTADKLFLLHYKKHEYDKALVYAQDVVELNPNLIFGWQHLIDAYKSLDNYDKASEIKQKAIEYFISIGYEREKILKIFELN